MHLKVLETCLTIARRIPHSTYDLLDSYLLFSSSHQSVLPSKGNLTSFGLGTNQLLTPSAHRIAYRSDESASQWGTTVPQAALSLVMGFFKETYVFA